MLKIKETGSWNNDNKKDAQKNQHFVLEMGMESRQINNLSIICSFHYLFSMPESRNQEINKNF